MEIHVIGSCQFIHSIAFALKMQNDFYFFFLPIHLLQKSMIHSYAYNMTAARKHCVYIYVWIYVISWFVWICVYVLRSSFRCLSFFDAQTLAAPKWTERPTFMGLLRIVLAIDRLECESVKCFNLNAYTVKYAPMRNRLPSHAILYRWSYNRLLKSFCSISLMI